MCVVRHTNEGGDRDTQTREETETHKRGRRQRHTNEGGDRDTQTRKETEAAAVYALECVRVCESV